MVYIYIYRSYRNGCEIFAKQKNVFLVTLKISYIVVTTALKKIYIYIYIACFFGKLTSFFHSLPSPLFLRVKFWQLLDNIYQLNGWRQLWTLPNPNLLEQWTVSFPCSLLSMTSLLLKIISYKPEFTMAFYMFSLKNL